MGKSVEQRAREIRVESQARELAAKEAMSTGGRLSSGNFKGGVMSRSRWIWRDRVPVGALTLLAGREGAGKSTIALDLAASISRGDLPGEFHGMPRTVLLTATEDSYEHTIVPRLVAAKADLEYVYQVRAAGSERGLILPDDLFSLEELVNQHAAGLLILDPLTSRLGALDTHKDAEVRQALEPLVALADRTGMAILALIHNNKTSTDDPNTAVMGSRAFTAVPRSVLIASVDPDDESRHLRVLAQSKNSLGPLAPTLGYRIIEKVVGDDGGPIKASKVEWLDEDDRNAYEITRAAVEKKSGPKKESVRDSLETFLRKHGPTNPTELRLQLDASGSTLDRAARELGVVRNRTTTGTGTAFTWELP